MLLQVFAANKVLGAGMFAANKDSNVGSGNKSKRVEPEIRRLESQKLAKSQKLKKLSKNGNLPNFDIIKAGSSFLIPKARTAFNHLWLVLTKAPILWHFDPECHI